jgi:FixJ family two-component response regulator
MTTPTVAEVPLLLLTEGARDSILTPHPHEGRHVQQVPLISIIDDDESVRIATKTLVRSLGFAAHSFASPHDFLTSESVGDSSCIIADIQMPGLSGVELQRRLLAQGNNTSIIFITTFPDDALRERVLEAGAVCFLTKPFAGESLIQCLEKALERRNGATSDR